MVAGEELKSLVGGHSAGKADRQDVGLESLGGRLDVPGPIAAQKPVSSAAPAQEIDHLRPLGVAGAPQLLVGDLAHCLPHVRVENAIGPVLAQVLVEQLAHRAPDPGGDVHAVGHVPDRRLLGLTLPERRPHPA